MNVCGKRCFFEDFRMSPVSKRSRLSSPVRCSPPRSSANSQRLSTFKRLVEVFPGVDKQLIDRVLEECHGDLDFAIKRLDELCVGSANASDACKLDGELESNSHEAEGAAADTGVEGESGAPKCLLAHSNLPMDAAQWVEFFITEMMHASNMNDARARASASLESLEKSIVARAGAEAGQGSQQEIAMLKEQIQALVQENSILKRAVAKQHERQKSYEDQTHELQHLKQRVSQYEEQLPTLEANNYALAMHLKQALPNFPMPGRGNPDIF